MKILILGADGYLGWPTAMYLARKGHEVYGADSFVKRRWENSVGVEPLVPVATALTRAQVWDGIDAGSPIHFRGCDLANHREVYKLLEDIRPDAIVHYAEQPSAPYSMMGRDHAVETQTNNVVGTLNLLHAIQAHRPEAHLIKLGTMGEYGTPNVDIEEGWLELEHKGRKDRVLYPKKPGSFYHLSKVHDSHNIEFACRIWGLRATDLNQGVVYGAETDETKLDPSLNTSFHYDAVFGTVINRFLAQAAAGVPLTVYGKGGQTRGYLNIRDTLRCIELACLNPAREGEFRVFNQFTEQFSVNDLARKIIEAGRKLGLKVEAKSIQNPRIEQEEHYYNAVHTSLPELGLEPTLLTDERLAEMLEYVLARKNLLHVKHIMPDVRWKQRRDLRAVSECVA